MLMLPALSRLMQLHGHKVIGKKLIAVLANLIKKVNHIRQNATDMEISPHQAKIRRND